MKYKFRELNAPVKEAPVFLNESLKYLVIRNAYEALDLKDDEIICVFYCEGEARNYIKNCTTCPHFYRIAILEGEF